VVTEIGSGLNGKTKETSTDPAGSLGGSDCRGASRSLVWFGFDLLEAALAASGRHVVVIKDGEVTDDLVQDVLEILTLA
jgi:putative resolvase